MARSDSFGIAPQDDWGVPESSMAAWIPVESVDVGHNIETIDVEETTGTRFPAPIETGTRFGQLGVSGPVRAESFGHILYATFGEPTTDSQNAPAYEHTFDPAGQGAKPLPVSLTVARVDPSPGIIDRFEDAVVNTLSLSCEPNSYVSYEATFLARDYAVTGVPSPSFDFSQRFPFHTLTAYIAIGGGSEKAIPLASWSMEFNNNVPDDVFVLGRRTLWELVEGNADCTVSFTSRADLAAHYRRALLETPEQVSLRLVAAGGDIGSGSVPAGAFTLEVSVPMLEYTEAPANLSAGDRLNTVDVSARAAFDDSSGKFVVVKLVNSTTDYANPGVS